MPGRTECALFRPITARLDPTTIPMRPITTSNSPFVSREYRTVSPPKFGRASVIIVGGRRVREDRWLQAAELRHRLLVPTGCAANHPVHEVGMDYGFSRSVLPTEGIYDMQMAIANHYWYQVAARLCLKGRWRSTAFRSGRRWETSTFPRSGSAKWRARESLLYLGLIVEPSRRPSREQSHLHAPPLLLRLQRRSHRAGEHDGVGPAAHRGGQARRIGEASRLGRSSTRTRPPGRRRPSPTASASAATWSTTTTRRTSTGSASSIPS